MLLLGRIFVGADTVSMRDREVSPVLVVMLDTKATLTFEKKSKGKN